VEVVYMVLLLLFNTELTRESSLISFQSLVVVLKGSFVAVKKGRVVSTLSEEVDSLSWRVVSFTFSFIPSICIASYNTQQPSAFSYVILVERLFGAGQTCRSLTRSVLELGEALTSPAKGPIFSSSAVM
jgi:hypothetical protein